MKSEYKRPDTPKVYDIIIHLTSGKLHAHRAAIKSNAELNVYMGKLKADGYQERVESLPSRKGDEPTVESIKIIPISAIAQIEARLVP